jgi:ABC-type dipeptide/oligopeptide/nickel transport system permease subunit
VGAGTAPDLAVATGLPAQPSEFARVWRRFRHDRVALASLAFVVLLVLVAVFAPLLVQWLGVPGPNVQDPSATNAFGLPLGPDAAHPFGVDGLGRDVLARTLYGTRTALVVGLASALLATAVAVVVGVVAGYCGGWVDTLLSRFVDVMLSFPVLLLGLGLASACSLGDGCIGGTIRPGTTMVVLVIALVTWSYGARLIRGQVLSLRTREFVEAARSLGASGPRIVFREILPHLSAPIIVSASVLAPVAIMLEAALSYLGVGVGSGTSSWGQMIADATPTFDTAWWGVAFPGTALLLTVLAFNLLGDGLEDALNPKEEK